MAQYLGNYIICSSVFVSNLHHKLQTTVLVSSAKVQARTPPIVWTKLFSVIYYELM
jgi:hypothetical protein